ncbi:MAG: DUF2520 domain-containing protein [Bacteroides sp.]|nr:DUF2520 domain-containing protein [Bacteroides sp.]
MKIDIIGTGKVANHLYSRMISLPADSGIDCRMISSRTLEGLRPKADLLLIAVSDSAIREVAERVRDHWRQGADGKPNTPPPLLAHVSGSTPIEVLGVGLTGVFYPFQSFAEGVTVDFSTVPIMIEGNCTHSRDKLFRLAETIGCRAYDCDGQRRRELHLCGVLACNFVNELIGVAQERLREAGLPPELIEPLVRKTVDKALVNGAENVRTGPAVRGDSATINAHKLLLSSDPALKDLYTRLSDLIIARSR